MRRWLTAAFLIVITALPVCAQRRGMGAPRGGASVGVRPGGRVIVRGGFGFGHHPRFGVFFNPRPFRHHRFIRPFGFPFGYPFAYPYTAYPYYPYGLQSDFVYSSYPAQQAVDYSAGQNAVLVSDLQRLQSELDQLKQQQAIEREQRTERQQYAMNSPTSTPQPIPRARPEAPPTVLIFRDGHKTETRNYAVAGQTLWIFSEERARKVPLASLDLDATHQANEERGVEFALQPRSPTR